MSKTGWLAWSKDPMVSRWAARTSRGSAGAAVAAVIARWARSWSPEQISNRLRLDFPDDESMRVSHEAIYQSLFVQGRGALKRELTACPPARTRAWLARNAGVLPEGPIVDDILARGRSFAASSADCSFPSCSSVAAGVPRCTTTMSSASPGSRCTA